MKNLIIPGLAAMLALASAPAMAGKWDEEKELCTGAIAAEAGVEARNYSVKLTKVRDRATKQLTLELRADGQPTIVGECKVRGDEVVAVELDA